MIWETDVKGALLYLSPHWERVTGQSMEAYGFASLDKGQVHDDHDLSHVTFRQIQSIEQRYIKEFRPSNISGAFAWVWLFSFPPIRFNDEEFARHLGIVKPLKEPDQSSTNHGQVGQVQIKPLDVLVDTLESPKATLIEDMADRLILVYHLATEVGDELLLNIINIALKEVGRKLAMAQVLEAQRD